MRPAKVSEFTEDAARPLRRGTAPGSSGGAVIASDPEPDPTLEIRNLIEQLQHSAREARAKLQRAEAEREELGRQLERTMAQVDELRARERDQRTQFTEITTIIRERDAAQAEAERLTQAATRAQEQLALAARQRDEAVQRLEGLSRAYSESGLRVTELQKQLATIRQARDSAHAQNSELNSRLGHLEEEAAELSYQRDQARKAQQQAEEEAATHHAALANLQAERAGDLRRLEELHTQLDEQRRKFLDLAEQKSAVAQAGTEHAIALAEARAQVASLAQERDTARSTAQGAALELEKLRVEFHAFREVNARTSAEELATLRERLSMLETQARQAREETTAAQLESAALSEKLRHLEVLAEDATARREEAERQFAALQQQAAADRTELQSALILIDDLTAGRTAAEESRVELEAQLIALRTQAASGDGATVREMQGRLERQRLQTLELSAQLETAQRNIRELSASLAEARLQVKFALGPRPAPGTKPAPVVATPSMPASPGAESLGALVPELREGFEGYAQDPADNGALLRLHDRVISYAERARVSGCVALYRLAQVFASLLESLAAAPGKVNVSTLHTIRQAVEFFIYLRDDPEPERFTDPARARVLMVDDDPGNCQCVQLVMQEQMIQTSVSYDPTTALLELASEPFDLVLLDVNMPGMNGFELCKRLRELPFHGQTPVVFLTGLATEERREQSILAGGNDFLGKPFNLHELTVKALLLIIQRQVAEPLA